MLIFAGVGPGDPELLTLKAVRVLREADAVAYADTGKGESVVLDIVGRYIAGKPRIGLRLPMAGSRAEWEQAHAEAAETLLRMLEKYPCIVYPVLGDPGIYATSSYLLRRVAAKHPCQIVPGISSVNAAAAELGIPLCEQRESLTILDALRPGEELPAGTVAVMKCGKNIDDLRNAATGRRCYAVRNLGMEDAWAGPLEDMPDPYSYFTTAIIRPEGAE